MAFEANISLNRIAYSVMGTLKIDINNYEKREQIKFEAVQFRALMLRRDLQRNPITRNFLQYICLDLECVDLSECCDISSYTKVLRTTQQIPIPLRTKDFDSFYFVGEIDKGVSDFAFKETSFDNIRLMKFRKFTSTKPLFVYDKYVYLFNPPTQDLKYINIGSIFEDPRQLIGLNSCNGNSCYTDDDYFPIGADQYPAMEEYLIKIISGKSLGGDTQVKINQD